MSRQPYFPFSPGVNHS